MTEVCMIIWCGLQYKNKHANL